MVDKGRYQVAVINLLGVVYLEPLACPFDTLDALLKQAGNPRFCVVDFHAEATAEKRRWRIMPMGAFRRCSAPTRTRRRRTSRFCRKAPAF